MFIFGGFVDMNASDISKADILKTLDHIQALSREQKATLVKAQNEYDGAILALKEQAVLAQQYRHQAHENAKERDVVIVAFSIVFALYLGTFFAGEIMRDFPTPWNIVATGLCYITIWGLAYGLGRVVLHSLATLIP